MIIVIEQGGIQISRTRRMGGSQPYTLFKFSENQYEIKDILDRREFLGIALLDPPL